MKEDRKIDEMADFAGGADVAIVGAGHAGVEAAMAVARLGYTALLFTLDLDSVANLPCNPSVGGTAKGQLVREIDAMGGLMGKATDYAGMQFRMLNASKGAAVHSPRAQVDRVTYQTYVRHKVEETPGIFLREEEVVCPLFEPASEDGDHTTQKPRLIGVMTSLGMKYRARKLIIATGTYLEARILVGLHYHEGGPNHHFAAKPLAQSLKDLGLKLQRFKTGTPVRIHRSGFNPEGLQCQSTDDEPFFFSFANERRYALGLESRAELHPNESSRGDCYITWTNPETHQILRDNLDRSPMYSGLIEATGTRYCPSVEDKIVKFPDKERHQIFVEPMGLHSEELYLQGLSSSMPAEVQEAVLHSVKGLEHAWIQRMGYAIEYTCLDPSILELDLSSRDYPDLYFAGQVVGSSGYEEAAAQGLMAGLNACRALEGKEPAILDRASSYIGVLIDDLVTRGTPEPYRMMTSRAEYRLLLRQDNADARLTPRAHAWGLVSDEQLAAYETKDAAIRKERQRLESVRLRPDPATNLVLEALGTSPLQGGVSLAELFSRPEVNYATSEALDPERPGLRDLPLIIRKAVENEIKYQGYIKLEEQRLERFKRLESKVLPQNFDYSQIKGLKKEAVQKLNERQPRSVGQAGRISGVSPADISVLLIYLEAQRRQARHEAKSDEEGKA